MLLAVLQASAAPLDVDANLKVIDSAAQHAAAADAAILLTPELFPVGYEPLGVRAGIDPMELPAIRGELARIASTCGIGLVYSLPAVGPEGDWHITATLLDASGAVLLEYAKVHLFGEEERKAFVPAAAPPAAVDFNGLKVSLLICYDAEFPETVRAAAVRGAKLLLVPTALAEGFDSVPQVLLRARALESQVYVAYANHCGGSSGERFLGGSIVAGPDGAVRAEAGESAELIFAEVSPDAVASARNLVPYLRERRPDLYAAWGL
ncbi:nitrilase-related carbon-nitrogen hydrolase [Arthrobacter sp. ISL-30]|uniref:nitrilase-related carbon-nitrogen hydrolase n=1 Tax=Arthrobacter sp. ISL-30 TaxID=2819109 RepID=UPI001BEA0721|nr:nitrilase-related carbon-nitrogen hydrolase [Arthrobacter sp. ISL-30]MBT2515089.1 nitrilase [Arthrobacter sp. ISL-30]